MVILGTSGPRNAPFQGAGSLSASSIVTFSGFIFISLTLIVLLNSVSFSNNPCISSVRAATRAAVCLSVKKPPAILVSCNPFFIVDKAVLVLIKFFKLSNCAC